MGVIAHKVTLQSAAIAEALNTGPIWFKLVTLSGLLSSPAFNENRAHVETPQSYPFSIIPLGFQFVLQIRAAGSLEAISDWHVDGSHRLQGPSPSAASMRSVS